jgi:hypothetical protein
MESDHLFSYQIFFEFYHFFFVYDSMVGNRNKGKGDMNIITFIVAQGRWGSGQ